MTAYPSEEKMDWSFVAALAAALPSAPASPFGSGPHRIAALHSVTSLKEQSCQGRKASKNMAMEQACWI